MNRILIFTVALLYGTNVLVFKQISDSVIVHSYLNDILAGAALVSFANMLFDLSPFRERPFGISWGSALPLAAGLFWEYVAPIYAGGTSDPIDLLAYILGGMVAWCFLHNSPKYEILSKQRQQQTAHRSYGIKSTTSANRH